MPNPLAMRKPFMGNGSEAVEDSSQKIERFVEKIWRLMC
jgi:hypothetical protein